MLGRRALVTGASRGLGRAIALALATAGADVALVARSNNDLDELAGTIRAIGREAWVLQADLSDPAQAERLATDVLCTAGPIDVLVNNASAQGPIGPLEGCSHSESVRTLNLNLVAAMVLMRELLPCMVERRRGSIVNISGGGALGPRAYFSAYSCSKAGLVRLTETVAEEVQPFGVRINAIAPGAMNTSMLEELLEAGERAGSAELARARAARDAGPAALERAAALAVFLASDASWPLTGKIVSAPNDCWDQWQAEELEALTASDWYTMRRVDPYTMRELGLKENVLWHSGLE